MQVLFSMGNIGLMFLFSMGNVVLMFIFYMKTPSGLTCADDQEEQKSRRSRCTWVHVQIEVMANL
jgi:hypothetical protein